MNPLPCPPAPGESPLAYDGFLHWFNLPDKDRKLKRVAEDLDVCLGTVKSWSSEFKWSTRLLHYKARLMGSRAEAEAEVIKKQTLAKADLDIQEVAERAVRLQQMKELHRQLTDEYVLHNSRKTRLHELTGLMSEIAKEERTEALLLSKIQSSQSTEVDSEFEEELQRAYGDQAKSSTPPSDEPLTDGAGI